MKMRGEKVGSHNLGSLEVLQTAQADLFVDLTPTNLKTGEPGLSLIRHALKEGMNVVTANKGPLVLAYSELTSLARKHEAKLHYSATVTGGLPTLNIGVRDLAPSEITGFEGIVNATTNYILTRMSEGDSFEAALKHAQDVGHAEADPSLDVDGWDAANKLVIIANSVLRHPTKLGDVQIVGIRGITQKKMREANQAGKVIKLVAKGERLAGGDWKLSVKPMHLFAEHPLARVAENMMGVIYHTDINGTIMATIEERDPYPTAAAVLRDMVAVYH
jgi:homoserine dehydrogenase